MAKYLLVEPKVKAKAPNIALMKWARWCEINSHEYQYVRGRVKPKIYPDKIYISCIFSYNAHIYEQTINYYRKLFPEVQTTVGGVFPSLYPQWFEERWQKANVVDPNFFHIHCGLHQDIENLSPKYDVDIDYEDVNPPYPRDKIVLYASRGCTNKCGYCAVPRLEGDMKSFKTIKHMLESAKNEIPEPSAVVLYDNNFTEHKYFDNIVNELIDFNVPVDIHGLHVDAFTEHHAEMFSKLKWGSQNTNGTPYLRFSFDKTKYANNIERALKLVDKYNVKAQFFCYMLFNFTDTPDDFWWRLQKAQNIVDRVGRAIYLFPQRYEPFSPNKRNEYVGPKWTKEMVRGLVKMYTYIHGFMSVTPSKNLFNWIGHTREDFFRKIKECANGEPLIKTTIEEEYPEGIIYE
jgi:hypothetical protein